MPRKSSFLMGFETGQDLYSRGFQRSQQRAQLQLQRDAADQRGKLLDLQMRTAAHEEENRNRFESNRKIAEKAFSDGSRLLADSDAVNNDDDFEMQQKVWRPLLPDLMKNKPVYDRWKLGNDIIKAGMAAKRKQEADDQVFKNSNRDSRAASRRRDADADTVVNFNSQFGTNYTSKEFGEVREWTTRINKLGTAMGAGIANQESPEYGELLAEFPGNVDVLQEELLTKRQEYNIAKAKREQTAAATLAMHSAKSQIDSTASIALEKAKKNFASGKYNAEQYKALNDNWTKLRADKIVVSAGAAQAQFSQIEELFRSRGADNFTAADDLAFVFLFMKSLDPQSVVREGEFANAQNATGVPARIRNKWNEMLAGNRLNAQQRNEFYDTAKSSVTGMRRSALKVINSYSAQMTHMGLPDERFQAIRDMIGAVPAKEYSFKTKAEMDAAGARGEIEPGSKVTFLEPDGGSSEGVWNTDPEPATQQPAVPTQPEGQPTPEEPIPPAAQHDAGNPDAYKTNKTFQKHFGQLDDAGQRARWREVYEQYTTGGVLPPTETPVAPTVEPAPTEDVEGDGDKPKMYLPGKGLVDEAPAAVANEAPTPIEQEPVPGLIDRTSVLELIGRTSDGLPPQLIKPDDPDYPPKEQPREMVFNGKRAILYGNRNDGFGLDISGDGEVFLITLDQINKAMEKGLLKLGDK